MPLELLFLMCHCLLGGTVLELFKVLHLICRYLCS